MLPKDVASRLREHSGLSVPNPKLAGSAFVDRVQAIQRGEYETDLGEVVADVIDCLQHLNDHNLSSPEKLEHILTVDVVYAISGMTLSAIETSMAMHARGKDGGRLLMAAWKIGCAWDALLAGDIEDIRQHLELEMAAKNLGNAP